MVFFCCVVVAFWGSVIQVGVVAQFFADGGLGAVAAVDDGVGGELRYDVVEAGHEVVVVAAIEVGASDAHLEEGVAGEGHVFFRAVEDDAAGGVAGGLEDGELVVAEADHFVVIEIAADGREGALEFDADD